MKNRDQNIYRIETRKMLVEHFSEEDLKTLCFSLGVDYDNLSARGKENKARDLVIYLDNRGEILRLQTAILQNRPHILWPDVLSNILYDDILLLLIRYMDDENSRKEFLTPILKDYPKLYEQIKWTGTPDDFTVKLIKCCRIYSEFPPRKNALVLVLESVKANVELDKRKNFDDLLPFLETLLTISDGQNLDKLVMGKLNNVPRIPEYFLSREDEVLQIKTLIIHDGSKYDSINRIGLFGMGGIGKSVLAALIARDHEVRQIFPDGIYWLTLGRKPNLMARQSQLAQALGDGIRNFQDVQHGRSRLSDLLSNKSCLLIFDDVWEIDHIHAFNIIETSSNNAMIMTTRDANIVRTYDFFEYQLGVLDDAVALNVLARAADKIPDDVIADPVALEVASECGNLPLALSMIGAMVRGQNSDWKTALARLRQKNLAKIRYDFPDYPYPNLLKAIEVSVEALKTAEYLKDIVPIDRYFELAIFPEDTSIPIKTLQVFWSSLGLDDGDVVDLINTFVDRSLAQSSHDGNIILHDLQVDYVQNKIEDAQKLHKRLLSSYRQSSENEKFWSSGPNDGYFYQYLLYHLNEVNEIEAKNLLMNFTWIMKKLKVTNINHLLSDYNLIISDIEDIQDSLNEAVVFMQRSLSMSAHVLAEDKEQLLGQLMGRLLEVKNPFIQGFLKTSSGNKTNCLLRPLIASLTPPTDPLFRTIQLKNTSLNAVHLSPNGELIVAVSEQHIHIWEFSSGREIKTLKAHLNSINDLAVTPDGQFLITASSDGTCKVWSLPDLLLELTFRGNRTRINSIAITYDGRFAISGDSDCSVLVWEIRSGQIIKKLQKHSSAVNAVAVSNEGKYISSATWRGEIYIWDMHTWKMECKFSGHKLNINSIKFSPDSLFLLSGSSDRTLKKWDIQNKREIFTIQGHSSLINDALFSIDGKAIISASSDKTLKVWNSETGNKISTLSAHSSAVNTVSISPDNRFIISAANDSSIRIWRFGENYQQSVLQSHKQAVSTIGLLLNSEYVVTGAIDGTLKIWQTASGRNIASYRAHAGAINTISCTEDSSIFYSASTDKTLKLWNISGDSKTLMDLTKINVYLNSLLLIAKNQQLLLGTNKGVVGVLDLTKNELPFSHKPRSFIRRYPIKALAITPDNLFGILGSHNTLVKWDLMTGKRHITFNGHTDTVNDLSVSLDGSLLVSASEDKTLKLWDIITGQELNTYCGHILGINAVMFLSSGNHFVSVSNDRCLKLWQINNNRCVMTFNFEAALTDCQITSNDQTIIIGDDLGRVHFLNIVDQP